MAPMQKHAWWSLGVGIVVLLALVVIVSSAGATSVDEDAGTALAVWGLFAGGLVAHGISLHFVRRSMDERDREIMNRAPTIQSIAILVTVAIWSVLLPAAYRDEGSIPLVYPSLIFGSTFVVNVLARSVGVLLGYAGWSGWAGAEG